MTLVRRNYRSLDNLFDEFFNNMPVNWGRDTNFTVPPVNIHESNEAYLLELIAPGLEKEQFNITLEKGMLTISYEKKSAVENSNENNGIKTHKKEFAISNFKRSFNVDDKIDAEKIEAKYENGILKLYLPKKEEVKVVPKQISIQ